MHLCRDFAVFTLVLVSSFANSVLSCGYPGAPAHSALTFSGPELKPGVVATYACERGFELLGPSRRVCNEEGTWAPEGIPFCVLNVAAGKAPMQSSVAGTGVPQKAVDGSAANFFNPETCTLTQPERAPWWYVNLLEPYMVQLVRLDFGKSCCGEGQTATIVVRVGNNRPDLGVNPVCNKFTGVIEEGKPLFLPCNPPLAGAFVSVQLESPPGNALSICEAFVYTDQALPIERCPHFRDQVLGSTATYNGKCYNFYSKQSLRFEEARQFCTSRGGALVDDSNPALQGFLSWEMWRRHRSDPNAQYWLGAVRDTKDNNNWKWLNGRDVTVSFWNSPTGRGNCARFDGAKGWLWSHTGCNEPLSVICQHGPKGCGRPEQPPNSTLLATSLEVGAVIEHRCDTGHVLVGPSSRTCLPNGFYSEFPPVCRYLECGFPAQIPNGHYTLLNGTRGYQSMVRYSCDEGHVMVGRSDLMCDIDQKWNGPPPRCEAFSCPDPPVLINGGFKVIEQSPSSLVVEYECDPHFTLQGPKRLSCSEGSYDQVPPTCKSKTSPVPSSSPKKTVPSSAATTAKSVESTTSRISVTTPQYSSSSTVKYPDAVSSTEQETEDEYPHYEEEEDQTGNGLGNGHVGESETNEHEDQTVPPVIINDIESKKPGVQPDFEDNEVSESNKILTQKAPGVETPKSAVEVQHRESAVARLNLGGIIALGVFGGFILLAAIVTSIVLLIRSDSEKDALHHNGRHHSHHHPHQSGPHTEFSRRRRRSRSQTADTAAQTSAEDIINEAERGGGGNKSKSNNKAKLYTLLALPFPDQTVGRRYLDAPNCHKWAGYFSEEPGVPSQVKGKHERHRGSPDSHTITSVDSGSDAGLGRLYRRAWDSLAATGGPATGSTTLTDKSGRKVPRDTLDFRSRLSSVEGMRDDGEMIVHDALPRKHHHHHGMHHHHHHFDGGASEWGRSVRSHRSRY